MWKLLLLLSCTTLSLAFQPGLKVPVWGDGQFSLNSPAELNTPFSVQFEFQSSLAPLGSVSIELQLPPAVQLIKGDLKQSVIFDQGRMSKKITWDLLITNPVFAQSLTALVICTYPIQALLKETMERYSKEPKHQVGQLLQTIRDSSTVAELSYGLNLYATPYEGLNSLSSLLYQTGAMLGARTYLLYDVQDSRHKNELEEALNILNKDFRLLKSKPLELEAFKNHNFGQWAQMLQERFQLTVQLGMAEFREGQVAKAKTRLQELVDQMLKEENLDYDQFLTIRNLQALLFWKDKQEEGAISILTESCRTAPNSALRRYLYYNLALLYLEKQNAETAKSYLLQAIKLNAGFSLAKALLKSLNSNKGN